MESKSDLFRQSMDMQLQDAFDGCRKLIDLYKSSSDRKTKKALKEILNDFQLSFKKLSKHGLHTEDQWRVIKRQIPK